MMKLFSVVVLFGVILNTGASNAAETPEEAVAKIEKDFAEAQITKDAKLFARIEAAMSDDFISLDPTVRSSITKKQLLAFVESPDYVVSAMKFPPFLVRVFGSTAVVQGANDTVASLKGKDASGSFVWLDVFEKRDGHWVWIVTQGGEVDAKVAAKVVCDKPYCQPGFSLKAGGAALR
jgi:hypothetical protein